MKFLGTALENPASQAFFRKVAVPITFLHEDTTDYVVVNDTLVTAKSRFQFTDIPEDLLLQNASFGVIDVVPGVKWTLLAVCSAGATGSYSVNVVISEVN